MTPNNNTIFAKYITIIKHNIFTNAIRVILSTIILAIGLCLGINQNLIAQKGDTTQLIHRYDLYKELQRRLPTNWEVHSRKDPKNNTEYFAIIRKNSWRLNRSITYNGSPEKEDEWAKNKGENINFEVHINFSPSDNAVGKAIMQQNIASNTPSSTNHAGANMPIKEPNEEIMKTLEAKYNIGELEKSENTKTYTAYTKEEKDRLVYFMLSKEYYTENTTYSKPTINTPITIPKLDSNNPLYVKDFKIEFSYYYPIEEYQPYPKSIITELDKVINLVHRIVNKQP